MNPDNKTNQDGKIQPQLFLESITFNDGTSITLNHNSIFVFTGANNCGKSQVLKDIENIFNHSTIPTLVVKSSQHELLGEIDDPKFFEEHFYFGDDGYYHSYDSTSSFALSSIKSWWDTKTLYGELNKTFVKRLCTEARLTSSNALSRTRNAERSPIYKLYSSEDLAQKISEYFHQAFNVDLVINRNDLQTVPLHIGNAPDKNSFTIANQDQYYSEVQKMPKLESQGDGMRSFASILLDTFTSDHCITLIDEPEAFLHPPQARVLGKMLAKNNSDSRQLFISTHSEDLLQGLLDSNCDNISVIRINRNENTNTMSVLQNSDIKKLWSNPILRYTNILSGLFHEKVLLCESDYDCLFYQALINAMCENKGEIAPDILFTHCGGKHRMKDVIIALKAVNVPVVSICDFDILNSKQILKSMVEAYGADWNIAFEPDMKVIYDEMNSKNDAWNNIKKVGKAGFTGNSPAAYERVESQLKSIGLFVVPVGEIECFDKTINKEKKEWVYHVLDNYDLANEPKLEEARKFLGELIRF